MSSMLTGSSASPSMLHASGQGPQPTSAASKNVRTTADHSLSCAECRRLKLKCNRQWPCETCVKRNIAHLCPDGTQKKDRKQAGGSRSAEADGAAVWDKLNELERKIDLLVSSQLASASTSYHQRAAPENLTSNITLQPSGNGGAPHNGSLHDLANLAVDRKYRSSKPRRPSESNSNSSNSKITATSKSNAQGSLTRGPDGRATYHGPNAHSLYFARELEEARADERNGRLEERKDNDKERERDKEMSPPELGQTIPAGVATRPGSPFIPVQSPSGLASAIPPLSMTETKPLSDGLNDSSTFLWTTPGLRSPHSSATIYASLRPFLPSKDAAWRMFQVCDACVTFMWDPLPLYDSVDHIFGAIYQEQGLVEKAPHPHVLSLAFATMALGILFDVRRQLNDPLGKQMYVCAWSALCMSNYTEGLGLDGMVALSRCIVYLTGRRGGKYAESAYPLHGTLMHLTISSGMHRDPAPWDVPVTTYMAGGKTQEEAKEAERERRRRVFWDLQCMDVFRSLSLHRPPSLLDRYVDTLFPSEWSLNDLSEQKDQSKGLFHAFKCIQTRIYDRMLDECLCTNNASNYEATMKLDEEIKHLIRLVPPFMQPALDEVELCADPYSDLERAYTDQGVRDHLILEMQRYTNIVNIHQGLILLHRTWFSRALQKDVEYEGAERASDPKSSFRGDSADDEEICDIGPFSHSVRTVLSSSSATITLIRALWSRQPALTNRWFFYWNMCFTAAVCCALYVIRAPRSKAAQAALKDVRAAIELLEKAKVGWRPLEVPYSILRRLESRGALKTGQKVGGSGSYAQQQQQQQRHAKRQERPSTEQDVDENAEEEEDGMELIGQERRLLKRKRLESAAERDARPLQTAALTASTMSNNGDSPGLFANFNDSYATGYLAAAAAAAAGTPNQPYSAANMAASMGSDGIHQHDPSLLASHLHHPMQPDAPSDLPHHPSSSSSPLHYPLSDMLAPGSATPHSANAANMGGSGTEASLWIQLLSSGIEWNDDLSNIDSLFS